ncbi:MAG TPA: Gfo/Idh/MocA family oxidoreductase, partial [Pyrinomonadaceae bacterium]|nr:Gfo/Idh/MocA family oxidoreductase [Pyrinomonadaceae bacterium]
NFEQAESFAREFGARRWHRDWRGLVADAEVEAVYIATPVHLHAEQTIAAANAGKHVLCEKPMAMSTKECDLMMAACEAGGVRLGVSYYRRFYPAVERIKSLLDSGEMGQPVLAQMNAFERFDPGQSDPRRWLLQKEMSGGGPLFDFGCHRIEVLMNLFGPIKEARGTSGNVLFEREVEDTASAVFQFERKSQATLMVTHAAREPQDTLSVFGSEASVHVAVLNEGELRIRSAAGERIEVHRPHQNFHQPLIEEFTRAVLSGRDPLVNGLVGREVTRVMEEVYASAQSIKGE